MGALSIARILLLHEIAGVTRRYESIFDSKLIGEMAYQAAVITIAAMRDEQAHRMIAKQI